MEGGKEDDEHEIDDAAVPPFLVGFEPEEAGTDKGADGQEDTGDIKQSLQHGSSISTWLPRLPACR